MAYRNMELKRENERKKIKRKLGTIKHRARDIIRHAVHRGKIIKPTSCSSCHLVSLVEAHHEDHSKPYEVMWLCPSCHRNLHKELFVLSGSMRKS